MAQTTMIQTFEVKGMHCRSCNKLVESSMEDIKVEIVSLNVDEKNKVGILKVKTDKKPQEIIKAVQELGDYQVALK